MDQRDIRSLQRVSALVFAAALLFLAFFLLAKTAPFREVTPFREDPFDAVGSMAIQVAVLIGGLTWVRSLTLGRARPFQPVLILRGWVCVLAAIQITVAADAIAILLSPPAPMPEAGGLIWMLVLTAFVALLGDLAVLLGYRHTEAVAPPRNLTPADAIDDVLSVFQELAFAAHSFLPPSLVEGIRRLSSRRIFSRIPWVAPDRHPWRFASAVGLGLGCAVLGAQLAEGIPSRWSTAVLLAGIFLGGELASTLAGFAALGGNLGLRPAWLPPGGHATYRPTP